MSITQEVIVSIRQSDFNISIYLFQLIVCICGLLTIAISIANIVKSNKIIHLLTTIISSIYVVMWFVLLFANFPNHITTYKWFMHNGKSDIIWLILYLAILLGILVLNILPYIPPRRPTKAERMQAQIDELQKQVGELKKGE